MKDDLDVVAVYALYIQIKKLIEAPSQTYDDSAFGIWLRFHKYRLQVLEFARDGFVLAAGVRQAASREFPGIDLQLFQACLAETSRHDCLRIISVAGYVNATAQREEDW